MVAVIILALLLILITVITATARWRHDHPANLTEEQAAEQLRTGHGIHAEPQRVNSRPDGEQR